MSAAGRAGALALATALAAGCGSLPGKPDPAERPERPGAVTDFATLYGTRCSGCHGADGRLGPARPLADPLYLALVDDATLTRVVADGIPGSLHPGFAKSAGGDLDDDEVAALVDGIRKRWAESGEVPDLALPPYSIGAAAPGDAARGARVFASRCASCHGSDGIGGDRAGSVVDRSWLALVTDQAVRTAVLCGRTDLGMPSFAGDGGAPPMSAADVSDVTAWIVSHRAAPGATEGE